MTEKKPWAQPKLIRINPFGGSRVNPYEYNGTYYGANLTVVFTAGGDNTHPGGAGPLGNITDYDVSPGNGTMGGPFPYSTVAPYS